MSTLITLYRTRRLGHGDLFFGWSRTPRPAPEPARTHPKPLVLPPECKCDWMISPVTPGSVAERTRRREPIAFEMTCPRSIVEGGHVETLTYSG
ncbi:MAG TPA: hypothetical protein VNN80_30170, partial [Polyangiaceae bacterium]|nr:hypothetical protein [Polyangiaceae bacterium]